MIASRTSGPIRSPRGVTLIEMLVVCVILMVVAAVTIPVLGRIEVAPGAQARSMRIEELLAQCRELAIRRGRRVRVVIDSSTSIAWIRVPASDSTEWRGPITMDGSAALTSANAVFSCSITGTVEGASIFVRDGRVVRSALVDPIAGRITGHL
jgi:Tfp pilus assembly protein FimT